MELSQEDKNLLQDKIEELNSQNSQLTDANNSARVEIAKRLIQDISFKKQTDTPHFQIAMYEEERKRLNGKSVVQALQEQGLIISDSEPDARLTVNDGRLLISENGTKVVDIPIIAHRGYSKSTPCGTDFDIWSRDRFGSSTSMPITSNILHIDYPNSKFRATINGETQEVDLGNSLKLPQDLDCGMISSSLQGLFRDIEINSTVSTISEPYSIIEGDSIAVSVDGELTPQSITFTGNDTVVTSINKEMFQMQDQDKIGVSVDGSSLLYSQFLTTAKAYCQNSSSQYYLGGSVTTKDSDGNYVETIIDGATLFISVDGGPQQQATFFNADFADITQATAAEVAVVLNRYWVGVTTKLVQFDTGGVDADGNKIYINTLKIEHDTEGGLHYFQLFDGYLSPNLSLDFPLTVIKADPLISMTAQEVCDVLNSGWDSKITASVNSGNINLKVNSTGIHNIVFSDVIGTPLGEIGLPDTYGFYTAQEVVDIISPHWTGVKIETCDSNGQIVDTDNNPLSSDAKTNIKVSIDGATNKFQISGGLNSVIGLSEHLILKTSGFKNCGMSFDYTNLIFTLASGTSGPDSKVDILAASINDMATTLNFLPNQYKITGKYANNILNVKIDGVVAEIKIGDFRKCDIDPLLGEVNDDYAFLWSGVGKHLGYLGTTRVGPLFCYQGDNGKNVASSIQAQLRAVGEGGFKDATCAWYSNDKTFIIRSGSFGVDSSVVVSAASDTLRDARQFLGYLSPIEDQNNEQYYDTLGSLANYLNSHIGVNNVVTHVNAFGVTDNNRICHSILYFTGLSNGVEIGNSQMTLFTSKIYENGAQALPRLYPNGTFIIEESNNKICFAETANRELIATIGNGTYIPDDLVVAIQNALNTAKEVNTYTVSFDAKNKIFTIQSTGTHQLLWQTGQYASISIGNLIGFDVTVDSSFAASHSGGVVNYINSDYYNPVYCSQFFGIPTAVDKSIDEQSALLYEQDLLKSEQADSNLLTWMQTQTAYDNEFAINCWENTRAIELAKVWQQYNALSNQLSFYTSHISESDAETTAKKSELNSLLLNLNSLNLYSIHDSFINLVTGKTETYTVTSSGYETLQLNTTDILYNRPAPLVAYEDLPTKHIAGDFTPSGLYGNTASFIKKPSVAFRIQNTSLGTAGWIASNTNPSGNFIIPPPASATVLSANAGTYNMTSGDNVTIAINNGTPVTISFTGTSGYTESRLANTEGFVINSANNTMVIDEGDTAATALSNSETFNLVDGDQLLISVDGGVNQIATFNTVNFVDITNATAIEVMNVLNASWTGITASATGGKIKITHNTLGGSHNFKITDSVGNPNIQLGFPITIVSGTTGQKNVVLSNGEYSGSSLAIQIALKLNALGGSGYTVNYTVNKFVITSNGAGGSGIFSLLWSLSNAYFVLGFTNVDQTGLLTYTSLSSVNYVVQTNVNDKFTMKIDSVLSNTITISQGYYTSATLVTEMINKIGSDPNYNPTMFAVTYVANKFRITSTKKGLLSKIEVFEFSGSDFLQSVLLDGDVPVFGGGDVGDITAVTATEVVNQFMTIVGISSVVDTGKVRVTTSAVGSRAKLVFTGGTALTILGFTLNTPVYGQDSQNLLKVIIDSDVSESLIILPTGTTAANILATDIQTQLRAINVGGYTNANCTWNETTIWAMFTDRLRIESGTRGISSNVSIGSGVVEINNTNNKIDVFVAALGTITITNGFYTPSSLASEIQTRLNIAGGGIIIFNVTYSGGKIHTSCSHNFSFKWQTGPNNVNSAYYILGFDKIDTAMGLNVTGEYGLSDNNAWSILGFDAGTIEDVGHGLSSVLMTLTDTALTTQLYWTDNGGGNKQDLNIDLTLYPTVVELVNYINTFPDYFCSYNVSAFLQSRVSGKYLIEDQDTLIINANGNTQTIAFNVNYGKSISGSRPQTKIISGSDTLILNINGAGNTSYTVTDNMTSSGQSVFVLSHIAIVGTSYGTVSNGMVDAPIAEGIDYTLSGNNLTMIGGAVPAGWTISIIYNWQGFEIILGDVDTSYDIAAKVQEKVRNLQVTSPELRASLLGFICTYDGDKYTLRSGVGGTLSSVKVYGGTAASLLKLGVMNGGIETDGTGSFCINSGYVTVAEMVAKINTTSVGFIASGTDYLILTSLATDSTCRIDVLNNSSLYYSLGFDNNNTSIPSDEIIGITSNMLTDVSGVEVFTTSYNVTYGWREDKNKVVITYATINLSNINIRENVVANRFNYITTRIPQITSRVVDIEVSLAVVNVVSNEVAITAATAGKYIFYLANSPIVGTSSGFITRGVTNIPLTENVDYHIDISGGIILNVALQAGDKVTMSYSWTLYQNRVSSVQQRLNKKTGTYVKVGDKYNEINSNNTTIASNTAYISQIEALIN